MGEHDVFEIPIDALLVQIVEPAKASGLIEASSGRNLTLILQDNRQGVGLLLMDDPASMDSFVSFGDVCDAVDRRAGLLKDLLI